MGIEEKDPVSDECDPEIATPVAARAAVGEPFPKSFESHAESVDEEDTVSEDAMEEVDSRRWIVRAHRPPLLLQLLLLFFVSLLLLLAGVRKALIHDRRYSGEGVGY